jgi:hypothetical protein
MLAIKPNTDKEQHMDATQRQLLNTAEVAVRLRKSRYWVQNNHKRLGIPSHKIGHEYFFVEPELDSWIESQRVTPITSRVKQASKIQKVSLISKAG